MGYKKYNFVSHCPIAVIKRQDQGNLLKSLFGPLVIEGKEDLKQKEDRANQERFMAFGTSRLASSEALPPAKPPLLALPKQCHQPGTKYSNT